MARTLKRWRSQILAWHRVIGGLLAGSGASTLRRMVETPDLRVDPQPVRPRSNAKHPITTVVPSRRRRGVGGGAAPAGWTIRAGTPAVARTRFVGARRDPGRSR